jgi:hypothetical protein
MVAVGGPYADGSRGRRASVSPVFVRAAVELVSLRIATCKARGRRQSRRRRGATHQRQLVAVVARTARLARYRARCRPRGRISKPFDAMWRRADERASKASRIPTMPRRRGVERPRAGKNCHVSALYECRGAGSPDASRLPTLSRPPIVGVRVGRAARVLVPAAAARKQQPSARGARRRHVYAAALLDAGVGIWEWDGVMLHADGCRRRRSHADRLGNLDPLSMRRNYESTWSSPMPRPRCDARDVRPSARRGDDPEA